METTVIRRKLHQFIDTIEDRKIEAISTMFENDIDTDRQRKKLIASEREQYLKGEGVSYSWEQVKQMAMHKDQRHGL
ncbi:hypothetical protein ABTH71_19870 [Acinetobacter baumannii]